MQITIKGPGGPGLRHQVEPILRAIDTPWMISVTTYGNPEPEAADYDALLVELNQGKTDNSYGNVLVSVHHLPWGG